MLSNENLLLLLWYWFQYDKVTKKYSGHDGVVTITHRVQACDILLRTRGVYPLGRNYPLTLVAAHFSVFCRPRLHQHLFDRDFLFFKFSYHYYLYSSSLESLVYKIIVLVSR